MSVFTIEEARATTGVEALEVNDRGQIRFRPGLSITIKKRHLKTAYRVYKKHETFWRFLLGDMVNDLCLPYGQKLAYCKDAFGEHAGLTIYGYSLTAACWNESRREWKMPWSLYKESRNLPDVVKCALAADYESNAWNLSRCLEFVANWKLENKARIATGNSSEIKTGQNPSKTIATKDALSTNTMANPEALIQAVQCIDTEAGLNALQRAIDARRLEIVESEEDGFAEE